MIGGINGWRTPVPIYPVPIPIIDVDPQYDDAMAYVNLMYREKADLTLEVSRELATYEDPRGESTGRVGLVESEPPLSAPARQTPLPLPVCSH